jgi:hypothetical protein
MFPVDAPEGTAALPKTPLSVIHLPIVGFLLNQKSCVNFDIILIYILNVFYTNIF